MRPSLATVFSILSLSVAAMILPSQCANAQRPQKETVAPSITYGAPIVTVPDRDGGNRCGTPSTVTSHGSGHV